jgi:hypothetical protein
MSSVFVKHLCQPNRDQPGEKPADDFHSLIERAAILLVTSSTTDADDKLAQKLYERANDCMIRAAHSPFFGGTKTHVSYEGLEIVRELVFERVRDELIARGYLLPKRRWRARSQLVECDDLAPRQFDVAFLRVSQIALSRAWLA